ncbi:TPA: transporter substrate-binding domain-containing protein [Pseudomonas putida]|uniref:transporter substrate-binding domain-containing protein n=1 Tax=Pseudomonas TaxID=286 RepID=UPI00110CFCBA|nr:MULTISPECIES: transporter substrate-binding domain-containing protein [Pseudomonas]MCS4061394.1 glutamate/aspartate transport system substrate-binding protein [Pseudomonas putida]MDD1993637.1 transporter substrate-binding domain-containing protein [Pseudomonas putida]HDS0916457.1 transporter substrate-binding domain-containing protein [Pseudomonas putida]HDS0932092.1 transporter substrate-binding domain-containing protein [Pseudomonas putida]HDS1781499.1 transporter substrate-binding domain
MKTRVVTATLALSLTLITQSGMATELTGTLKKIQESGTITLAFRDAAIPFSYLADASGVPVGYSQDIQLKIVDALKHQLDLPDLRIKYNLVTSQTRIPLIQNGTVDLECGSTTNNIERQQQVSFSVGIFEIGTRLLTTRDSAYKELSDLQGRNVVTTAGTTAERLLRSTNADQQLGMNIISAKDHGESFQMLETGRAVAWLQDDALLAGERAKSRTPEKWVIAGKAQSHEIYGCMLRKHDAPFKQAVDNAVKALYASGEIETIYRKWFQQPIPPKGLSLDYPLPEEVKALYTNPTDQPAPL